MSRDFEKAYRELAQRECPDLWDRIEAGLIEKSAPEKGGEEGSLQVLVQKDICQEEKKQAEEGDRSAGIKRKEPERKSGRLPVWKTYGGVAAAVVCAVIILPAFLKLGSTEGGSMEEIQENICDSGAPENPAAMAGAGAGEAGVKSAAATEEAGVESAAVTGEAGARKEAGVESAAVKEEDRAEGAAVMESAAAPDAGAGAGQEALDTGEEKEKMGPGEEEVGLEGAMAEDKAAAQTQGLQQQEKSEEKAKEPDGGMAFHILVEVKQAEDAYEGETPTGTLYTVVVQEDEGGFFGEGEQIEIYAPILSPQKLAVGQVFEVDIVYGQEEAYPYVLESCRRK